MKSSADATFLASTLGAMDMVGLRHIDGESFLLITEAPEWFALVAAAVSADGQCRLSEGAEYLKHFLEDARAFWSSRKSGRLRSGVWLEQDSAGIEWPFEAHAILCQNECSLIIEHLGDEYRQRLGLLQSARSHLLNEEALEREVQRRTASLRQREEEIAIRLLAAAGMRDEETGSHVRRIGLYAAAMGEALGWDGTRTAELRVAAPMHDVGKIGIPDAILLKPGRLTADEYRVMQQHTVIGAAMLGGSDIPLLKMSADIARCHHEKWDGSGYPNGLRGEAIPIAARIVALVDVYDAMVHKRVYKAPIPEVEVLDSMRRAAGQHFDPQLFEVFIHLLPVIRGIRETVPE